MKTNKLSLMLAVAVAVLCVGSVKAGSLDPSVGPTGAASQMFTLQQIYDRLTSGAAGTKMTTFTEPGSGPGTSTMRTLDEIMAQAPAADNTNGASTAQVLSAKTFWGLRTDGTWGLQTGSLATQTLTDANATVADGYYAATTLGAVDADLAAGNIRSGVTIFGVAGTVSAGSSAGVPQTGQTSSVATGDDGNLQKGVAWPNPRFTDNANGTVTDNLTGLIWLKDANCYGTRSWAQALSDANALASGSCSLTDGSTAGQWRLPNLREMQSLVHYGFSNPAVPNTAGTGQWTPGNPFTNVQSGDYWSSTAYANGTSDAWYVFLGDGFVFYGGKTGTYYMWPVRGGQ
jgi:hypothetical protein